MRQWTTTMLDFLHPNSAVPHFAGYLKELIAYSEMPDSEKISLLNLYPCISDKTTVTHFDAHYFYQDIWAFKKIYSYLPKCHVDIGSRIDFVGFLTAITKVTFVDIRPLNATLKNLISKKGNILCIPFQDKSVHSLSCLHVAEHIGLGRYGDTLDSRGTKKACSELSRVLAPSGNLYFSMPVGKPRLCFNAHRIHSPKKVLEYFKPLELVEFSGIDDEGNFRLDVDPLLFESAKYACGLFHFTKK